MPQTISRVGVAVILALVIVGVAGAALTLAAVPTSSSKQPAAKSPASPPIVSIKKVDGSTVRGRLVASDGLNLTIEPAVDKNTFGDAAQVPWKDVKAVSNGLTQKKAADAWKAAHKDELCDVCHGERVTVCQVCKGTGHDPESSKDCKTCKGAQQVACNHPKCDKGMIPCPAPCVKLGEGTWRMQDGKHVRIFHVNGGTAWVSEAHIGQIVKFDKAGGMQVEDCPTCGKTGKITCPTCHGTGFIPCPTCKADKKAADCASCDDGYTACSSCAGTGLKAGAPLPTNTGQLPPVAPPANVKAVGPKEPKAVEKKSNDGLD
jgi:hypothetical protein